MTTQPLPLDRKERVMRGRPSGRMTPRRQRVLEALIDAAASGEHISMCKIARRCGIDDYRNAKRIRRELQAMGAI